MPALVGILALCLLFVVGFTMSNSDKQSKKERAKEDKLKELDTTVNSLKDTLNDLEKRMANVEDIVTDAKFEEGPVTGREAINLKAEMSELKSIIRNLKK